MSSEIVTLVDTADQVIGKAPRSEMRAKGLCHRATYILVFSSENQLLLQKRTQTKDVFPGYFDAAAGGVLLYGESYEESATRELEEELGLTNVPLVYQFDHYYEDARNRCWGRVFTCQHDGPFKLQATEVQSAEFVDVARILNLEFEPLTPDTWSVLQRWQQRVNQSLDPA